MMLLPSRINALLNYTHRCFRQRYVRRRIHYREMHTAQSAVFPSLQLGTGKTAAVCPVGVCPRYKHIGAVRRA